MQATMYVASCLVEQPIMGKALATGYPLANTHIFILDEGLNPLPVGALCYMIHSLPENVGLRLHRHRLCRG